MAASYFFALSILLISKTGSSAEDIVFVQTGDSVQLDIQRDVPAHFSELSWENDKSSTIVKFYKEFNNLKNYYPDKAGFNNKTLSLTLKNMQENDSGVYTADIPGRQSINVAVYTVNVLDAVKAPVLTVISNSSSSDSCTVNFTCTGHDLTLNSIYTNSCCSPEDVTSVKKYTLILICSENTIICNHSNPVSWKTESTDTKQFCEEKPATHQESSKHLNLVIGCVVGFLVLVMAGFVLDSSYYWKRRKGGRQDLNTDYDGVGTPGQTRQEKESSTVYYAVAQP
ncbi:uncharacterized protein LOC130418047 isoform X2 [Triplophysa dalaica]|uniref:uncharacterized protein LOC130418047 isoform X2 n=1 Tax=Triplophysa dalaica TaxID=1582913 RepID=UPI0024DF3D89|nr:uncharacterized protein LOC130418047 isoform X2 [Triplophysa dalaica]